MCGILGVIQKTKEIDTKCFDEAFERIKPRGRKEYRYVFSPREMYGYTRLPTDGLSSPAHRYLSEKKLAFTLFNGIVTNTEELVEEFGLNPSYASYDTRVLDAGLTKHGTSFLNRVRGMFAVAHITENAIILARDTAGIKPLYFILENGLFAFASEMKALIPLARSRIHEVRPGEIVTFDKHSFAIARDGIDYRRDSSHTLEQLFIRSLIEPTQRYLEQSKKPIGLLLSGGLDSSILLGLLAKHLPKKAFGRIRCFCIGKKSADDTKCAIRLARQFDAVFTHVPLPSDATFLKTLPHIVDMVESPYARVAKVALLQDALAHAIKDADIDVVISGEGADELFYGYRKFIDGLTHAQVDEAYLVFFKEMFPQTLLQRLDRVFARHCIEGRVPFLDQDIVAHAEGVPAHKKVIRTGDVVSVKEPLRALARELGIPPDISEREKMPMLHGSTTHANTESGDGYLEEACLRKTGMSCSAFVEHLYLERYGRKIDPLTGTSSFNMRTRELGLAATLQRKRLHDV